MMSWQWKDAKDASGREISSGDSNSEQKKTKHDKQNVSPGLFAAFQGEGRNKERDEEPFRFMSEHGV